MIEIPFQSYLPNTAPFVVCVFRRVKEHHHVLHSSPLFRTPCVRQVVLDKWFPMIHTIYIYSCIHITCIHMNIYIYIYIYVCIHIYIHIIYVYTHTYVCIPCCRPAAPAGCRGRRSGSPSSPNYCCYCYYHYYY